MIAINVNGIVPEAQARPRFFLADHAVRAYSPKTAFYRTLVLHALSKKPRYPMDGPIGLLVVFRFPRPKSIPRNQQLKWTKPDCDNLLKAVKDALTAARWWVDDGRVCNVQTIKVYVAGAEQPGVQIKAWPLIDPAWQQKPKGELA